MIGARVVLLYVICIRVWVASIVLLVDVVEDQQSVSIVWPCKPSHHLFDNGIEVATITCRICPT